MKHLPTRQQFRLKHLPSSLWYNTHFSKQFSWPLRCSWGIACRRCSNYIFILDLTPGFTGLGKDNCKTRPKSLKFLGFGATCIRDCTVICLYKGNKFASYNKATNAGLWPTWLGGMLLLEQFTHMTLCVCIECCGSSWWVPLWLINKYVKTNWCHI